jgi:hypothetical protein
MGNGNPASRFVPEKEVVMPLWSMGDYWISDSGGLRYA